MESEQRRKRKQRVTHRVSLFYGRSLILCCCFFFACVFFLRDGVSIGSASFRPVLIVSSLSRLSSSAIVSNSVLDFSTRGFLPLRVEDRILFPDHTLLLVSNKNPSSLLHLYRNRGLDCVYHQFFNDSINAEETSSRVILRPVLSLDEFDELRSLVRCPFPPVNCSAVVNLQESGRKTQEIDNGMLQMDRAEVHSWEMLVYGAAYDGHSVVVFVKGLNLRADRESDPTQFRCHFGFGNSDKARRFALTSTAITAAQEVVRCSIPPAIKKNQAKSQGIRVTVDAASHVNSNANQLGGSSRATDASPLHLALPSVAKISSWKSEGKNRNNYELCACTMVWNQAASLREWIVYHAWLGVERSNACLANFTLPGNFPFGTPGATKYFARDAVTRLIEAERANCPAYLNRYIDLLECVNPVLELDQFHREVEQYWHDPNGVSLCWLSQFLMVLGLGCFATVEEPHQATELMMAAEACLMQTPFMFRPTLLALKSLTLMVVAKQMCNATCWSVDSCWSLLGLLVRAAFIYGLPFEKLDTDNEELNPKERYMRRKLWLTILYLDIKVSMCTGMPPLTRPDELGSLKAMPEWDEHDSLQLVLYQCLPTVLTILGKLNSKKDPILYPDVLQYNTQIRELMAKASQICTNQLQRITVDIFLRRFLMVLHRPFALHAEGAHLFPESYWGSLECSLALLLHYREIWGADPSLRLDLVGRAFVLDFFSAALTACLHVLSKEAPLATTPTMTCAIPPRQIILETLHSCVDIWGGEREKSVCWRTGYNLLIVILGMLPDSSGPSVQAPLEGQFQNMA